VIMVKHFREAAWTRRLGWIAMAMLLPGCAPGEEVSELPVVDGTGDDTTTNLKCWALDGSRCDTNSTNARENCKIPDCVIKVKQNTELELSAELERVRECGLKMQSVRSVLRVRRVRP